MQIIGISRLIGQILKLRIETSLYVKIRPTFHEGICFMQSQRRIRFDLPSILACELFVVDKLGAFFDVLHHDSVV